MCPSKIRHHTHCLATKHSRSPMRQYHETNQPLSGMPYPSHLPKPFCFKHNHYNARFDILIVSARAHCVLCNHCAIRMADFHKKNYLSSNHHPPYNLPFPSFSKTLSFKNLYKRFRLTPRHDIDHVNPIHDAAHDLPVSRHL